MLVYQRVNFPEHRIRRLVQKMTTDLIHGSPWVQDLVPGSINVAAPMANQETIPRVGRQGQLNVS